MFQVVLKYIDGFRVYSIGAKAVPLGGNSGAEEVLSDACCMLNLKLHWMAPCSL